MIFEKNENFLEIIKFTKSFEPGAIYKIFSEVLEKLKTPSCSLSFKEQNDFLFIFKTLFKKIRLPMVKKQNF